MKFLRSSLSNSSAIAFSFSVILSCFESVVRLEIMTFSDFWNNFVLVFGCIGDFWL